MARIFSHAILIAGALLGGVSGCSAPSPSPPEELQIPDLSADATWELVSTNAERMGAAATRVERNSGYVVYRGAPRDYAVCVGPRGGSTATEHSVIALDVRTTFSSLGSNGSVDSLYLATVRTAGGSGGTDVRSVSFSRSSPGSFDDGISCRATGKLEQDLFDQG